MSDRLRVGIFFGGPSREREISFAGGRTVYDNLDKRLFAPVPLFIDARRRLIELDWRLLYKGTIRDFWPPVSHYPAESGAYQLSEESLGELDAEAWAAMAREVGRPVAYAELPGLIDVAFLALHGVGGEDGSVQGALETVGIPYTGSGLAGSAIGMDKVLQKRLMAGLGFPVPPSIVLTRGEVEDALAGDDGGAAFAKTLLAQATSELGTPVVVRGANQGSSIGVSILLDPGADELFRAVERALFRMRVDVAAFRQNAPALRRGLLSEWGDLRHGIGFPLRANGERILRPDQLEALLDSTDAETLELVGEHSESRVVLEGFLCGKEVSTIVLREGERGRLALLPTEIVKVDELFDYRAKYLPGLSRKRTPADLPRERLEAVRAETERLFDALEFDVYARIDGFVTEAGDVYLNDPNTTSGMLPSSFFFHQAAEIGLSPRELLTYIVQTSLRERARRAVTPNGYAALAERIDEALAGFRESGDRRRRVAVLLGGYSSERHISVESGRNVYEKLASSGEYAPVPVFVLRDEAHPLGHRLFELPINLLLKDNADDIADALRSPKPPHASTAAVRERAAALTRHYGERRIGFAPRELDYAQLAERVDEAFIALHGRPGEDGELQGHLEAVGLSYNGSPPHSARVTIDKYETLRRLARAGFPVTEQRLVTAEVFAGAPEATAARIGDELGFPLIGKPVDDGCSSAVQRLDDAEELRDFLALLLGTAPAREADLRARLGIHARDEMPRKAVALVEQLIDRRDADLFLEITGGVVTRLTPDGELEYEAFEPSEALSTGEVLSLAEKFLAGEGQNVTPARFAFAGLTYEQVARKVRATLEGAARALGVEGYCRIDAFVRAWADGRVETVVIEVNSLPGMTPATCIYHQAALAGLTPYAFIDGILRFGRERRVRATSGMPVA